MSETKVAFTAIFKGFSTIPCEAGAFISSPKHNQEGRIWRLHVYPNAVWDVNKDFVSCFIACESKLETKASYKISIINQNGLKDYFHTDGATINHFKPPFSDYGWHEYITKAKLMDETNGYILNDQIMFRVELNVESDLIKPTDSLSPMRSIVDDLSKYLHKDSFADVTIHVGDDRFPAHKLILCIRSEVFRVMLNSNMLEAMSHVIEINDFEAPVVKELLHFMYTDSCTSDAMKNHCEQLLAIACKYQVTGLIAYCGNHLAASISLDNVRTLLYMADLYEVKSMKTAVLKFITLNAKAIIQVDGFLANMGYDLWQEVMKALLGVEMSENILLPVMDAKPIVSSSSSTSKPI